MWKQKDADALVARYGHAGVNEDIALRVYTSRLLGRDPKLVLHGGGNTSVKTTVVDQVGVRQPVLCVKGSGWDLGDIEPAGLPAVRIGPLLKAREFSRLSDEEMVALQRANLVDPAAPNPSVETLLHAYLPHKFVDHTHSTAILSLVDQPNGSEICRELFGHSFGIVSYTMPGFDLAKKAAEVFEEDPDVLGLILDKHGIFTFAEDAKTSYERMVDAADRAEKYIKRNGSRVFQPITLPGTLAKVADIAPIIRGACAAKSDSGVTTRLIAEFRCSEAILNYVNGANIEGYATRGVTTPDLVIRVKQKPLILPAPAADQLDKFTLEVSRRVEQFRLDYKKYFDQHDGKDAVERTMLDPSPRMVLVPGIGLFGLGSSQKSAKVAADVAENLVTTITDAESIGEYQPVQSADLFDLEYWSLEQAKLGKAKPPPLAGQVTVITGAAGAIGTAIARLFIRNGAQIALLDVNKSAVESLARSLGGGSIAIECDVTDVNAVNEAFMTINKVFGGVDILVSNAGAAWQGEISNLDESILRRSFELNFFAHQTVAQATVAVMRRQNTGGCLLFNTSKQAINPGKGFGAYGTAKAATLFLSRQYALECGADGIRSNAVNADRIRSGILNDEMISDRATARGVSVREYIQGNLLGKEVTAEDVALAFLNLALAEKTTGNVQTVDGGVIEAVLR